MPRHEEGEAAEKKRTQIEKGARRLISSKDKVAALTVLQNAVDRCRQENVRTRQVFAALNLLELCATVTWPFAQFRIALEKRGSHAWEILRHCQILNAAINGIRRALKLS